MPIPSPTHPVNMPSFVAHSQLMVVDLELTSAWYQKFLGLAVLEQGMSGIILGVAGRPLLTLTTQSNAAPVPRSTPGLYHNAFLVPSRSELAGWLAHAVEHNVRLTGASDHLVSEAIYLDDPEGNGIEVYRDRERDEWQHLPDGSLKMAVMPLDLRVLYDEAKKGSWRGMAADAVMGHIHLQVSDIPQAERFFRDVLGLDVMASYPGATFFASGKYHHHVGANVWNSRDQSKRQSGMAGLRSYTVQFNDRSKFDLALKSLDQLEIATYREGEVVSLVDPWGIGLRLVS
jgi:catechol 2,3-dioxygenase